MSKLFLAYILLVACNVGANRASESLQSKLENPAVKKFRQYIQIDTSQPKNLQKATEFWQRQALEYGLEFTVYQPAAKPICVLTWRGANTSLPSIMLNSHMDVVPAVATEWAHPPFAADVDDDGNIYGRGTQDTKDIAIQYLEAIGRLKRNNVTLQRTIHMTLMPDEEQGGINGMKPFVISSDFKELNVGFALDEGLTTPTDNYYAMYLDRRTWQIQFTVEGKGGHSSSMGNDVAVAKMKTLLDDITEYRESLQKDVLIGSFLDYGLYTTVNVNVIKGGFAPNVVPEKFTLIADLRLSPQENTTKLMSRINSWVDHAGNKTTTMKFLRQEFVSTATPVDDSNPYWIAMNDTITQLGYNLVAVMCPATSDMLFVRNTGVPAIGFAPKRHTKTAMHNSNEYLNVDTFLEGIDVYLALIKRLGNLPGN